MRFLWFGKKETSVAVPVAQPETLLQERYSVTGYICETNPSPASKSPELSVATVNSCILSIFSRGQSSAEKAVQEFFQERGAVVLPILDFSFTLERGFSARVMDGMVQRTVLIGPPAVIAHASAPFSSEITAAVTQNPAPYIVAIDGIAYASFSIRSEMV